MRNAAGDQMEVPQQATLAFDDPEAMCRAALLGLGVALIAVPHTRCRIWKPAPWCG